MFCPMIAYRLTPVLHVTFIERCAIITTQYISSISWLTRLALSLCASTRDMICNVLKRKSENGWMDESVQEFSFLRSRIKSSKNLRISLKLTRNCSSFTSNVQTQIVWVGATTAAIPLVISIREYKIYFVQLSTDRHGWE